MPSEKDFSIGSDISTRYGAGAEAADAIAEALSAERDRCARLVPTNWCDVLLNGSAAPKLPFTGPQVEALLLSIRQRIQNQGS